MSVSEKAREILRCVSVYLCGVLWWSGGNQLKGKEKRRESTENKGKDEKKMSTVMKKMVDARLKEYELAFFSVYSLSTFVPRRLWLATFIDPIQRHMLSTLFICHM